MIEIHSSQQMYFSTIRARGQCISFDVVEQHPQAQCATSTEQFGNTMSRAKSLGFCFSNKRKGTICNHTYQSILIVSMILFDSFIVQLLTSAQPGEYSPGTAINVDTRAPTLMSKIDSRV